MRTFDEFAKVDVYTGDIDPVYFAISRASREFGYDWATRFAVAMLTYYHTGIAAEAADYEGDDFWRFIHSKYDTAPRAAERRHWRGAQGLRNFDSMRSFSPDPNNFFTGIHAMSFDSYFGVQKACAKHLVGFGAYFVLKICDYMDRCLGLPIHSYAGLERNLPTLPAQAVDLLVPGTADTVAKFNMAVRRVQELSLKAPPAFDRPLGPAEVETILCDWKRAKYGNHIIGDDVKDKRDSLRGHGPKAVKMIEMFPEEFPLTTFRCELE